MSNIYNVKRPTLMQKAAQNYENVVGRLPSDRWTVEGHWRAWTKCERGSDLFIKGLGGFDIQSACRYTGYYNIPTPFHITSAGYRIVDWVLKKIVETPRLLDYLIKHWSFFNSNPFNLGRLDELIWFSDTLNFDRPPRLLLEECRRLLEEGQDDGDDTCDLEVVYNNIPTIEFKTEVGTIKPINSTQELVQVGTVLHNCARSYNQRIIEKHCCLMVCADERGKPLALAEITQDKQGPILSQISGPCNQPVSPEIRQAFINCLTNIQF